jgi:hypothetical protein
LSSADSARNFHEAGELIEDSISKTFFIFPLKKISVKKKVFLSENFGMSKNDLICAKAVKVPYVCHQSGNRVMAMVVGIPAFQANC